LIRKGNVAMASANDYDVIVLGGGLPGEWSQQATPAIRAHVPLEVLGDTIQPFPSFSGIYDTAVMALRMDVADMPQPIKPMDAQIASMPG
jgi:hypothetical protein